MTAFLSEERWILQQFPILLKAGKLEKIWELFFKRLALTSLYCGILIMPGNVSHFYQYLLMLAKCA